MWTDKASLGKQVLLMWSVQCIVEMFVPTIMARHVLYHCMDTYHTNIEVNIVYLARDVCMCMHASFRINSH